MKLDSNTINELVELLRPLMEDERNRRSLLILALGNDAPVLQHITWSGSVATFIPEMVCKLADYSEVVSGRQALWALLEYICSQSQVGVDVQKRIEKLRPLINLRSQSSASTDTSSSVETPDIDVLVQKVRSRLHEDIQSLHGTMSLWGVDRWVPLGDLFVDVNILEELSSSRRSELNDLWQDFSKNPSYRSLDRIGLGKERQRMSGLEVLAKKAKNTNLMVVGKPGSGKTTYLQRVVTECNAGNLQAHRIPVLIKLREFVEDGREVAYSLERYLERCWRLSDAETQLVLDRGWTLVLLDGLDEVTGENGKKIAYEIKRFARAYPQVQVIVTCRTQSFTGEMDWKSLRFQFVEVADFDEAQVRLFVEHWFKVVMGDESAGLARAQEFLGQLFLESNKPIRELAITPILLSLTCVVFHKTGKFYSKRSKLYEEGLELLLEQWDKSREIERHEIYRDLSVERKLELLSYLAVKKFEQAQYVLFEQGEIEGYIAEFLGIGQRDSRGVLRAIEAQHGLLIERSQKVWSFSHLTFQEYLIAKELVENPDLGTIDKLIIYIDKPKYREVIALASNISWKTSKLLNLKFKADSILASDKKIQEFIFWIYQKSKSNKSLYKSASIRAIFLYNSFILFDSFKNVNCRLQSHYFPIILGNTCLLCHIFNELGIEQKRKYTIAIKLESSKSDFSKFRIDCDFYFPIMAACANAMNYASDRILAYILLKALDLSLLDDSKIKFILQKLKYKLPKISEINFNNWWRTHGLIWTKNLMETVAENHNIGYYWWFKMEQIQLLKHYYKVNEFLVDCLNNCHELSDKLREEIEETLLLPIAEIENRRGTGADL